MPELRTSYAKEFFAGEYQLSRQEWMSKNTLVLSYAVCQMECCPKSKKTSSSSGTEALSGFNSDKNSFKDKLTGTLLGILSAISPV